MLSLLRLFAAFLGWIFGFLLGVALLEVSRIDEVDNRVIVVLLLATACGILGFLGVEYVTVRPARWLLARIRDASASDLIAGSTGAIIGLLLGLFLAFPIALLPGSVGQFAPLAVAGVLGLIGAMTAIIKKDDGVAFLRDVRQGRDRGSREQMLLDTSVIIDGRIADVARAGFLRGTLIIPRFILLELQGIADSSDALRRARGRRGLDLLSRLQKEALLPMQVIERDPREVVEVDAKLVAVARELNCPILTNDYNLNRVAELQGVRVLNVNELATAVRPVVLPGEELSVKVIQEGKEAAQGVGYLEDGTMIVVEGGARHLGEEIDVVVLRVLQTVAGRMIFAHPRGEASGAQRPRAVR
ncbi:MAG: PIN domain-containing protein [Chloroflexi bacterium]|nr:MAG: PIN domain-containing protein [Chloroflexota bacterium]